MTAALPHQTADYARAFYRGYGDTYGLHTLASVAGGGKFANGAITGAFGYLFNDLAVDAKGKLNYVPSQVGSELDVYEDFAANPQHTYPLALPLGAFGGAAALEALAGGGAVDAVAAATVDLNPAQAANFARFVNKLPAGAGTAFVDALGSDSVMFTAEVPGRVPGSSAVYQKIVDAGSENMYGLDKATDLSFLIDQEAIQLAIGIHDCQLVFSEDARISMQCELTFKSDVTSQLIRSEIANESKELYPLLGQRIKAIEIGEAGNLKLFFSGSHELTLYDSSESFESYIIWNKGDFIAV